MCNGLNTDTPPRQRRLERQTINRRWTRGPCFVKASEDQPRVGHHLNFWNNSRAASSKDTHLTAQARDWLSNNSTRAWRVFISDREKALSHPCTPPKLKKSFKGIQSAFGGSDLTKVNPRSSLKSNLLKAVVRCSDSVSTKSGNKCEMVLSLKPGQSLFP